MEYLLSPVVNIYVQNQKSLNPYSNGIPSINCKQVLIQPIVSV